MLIDASDRPGIDESYQTASNTSDLTVEADKRGAGDVLIAAGWSPSRLGMALMRLHSEWDAHARRGQTKLPVSELLLLANNLKSRPVVWSQIGPWLAIKGISSQIGAEALLYWLAPTCPACDGHGLKKVPGAPALSARRCDKCRGSGKRALPAGSGRVLGHLDYCVGVARGSLKVRLRNTR